MIFNLIFYVLNTLKTTIYWSLVISYKIGQSIVSATGGVLSFLSGLLGISKNAGFVLYEDFITFLDDILHNFLLVIKCILSFVSCILGFISSVSQTIFLFFQDTAAALKLLNNTLTQIPMKICNVVSGLFICVKSLIVLFGSGVWFVITLIPNGIVYTISSCIVLISYIYYYIIDFIIHGFISLITGCRQFYSFVSDIPIESVIGLLAGSCIIYALIKCNTLLFAYLKRIALYIFRNYIRYYVYLLIRVLLNKLKFRNKVPKHPENVKGPKLNNDDLFCVVCQERDKCILILPCKHLCLCNECNRMLKTYNRVCPICRTKVQNTMKVFL